MHTNGIFELFSDVAGKSLWLLAAAVLFMLLWRRGAPAIRHCIWLAALGGLLLLPAASMLSPFKSAPGWVEKGNFVRQWMEQAGLNQPPALPPISIPAGRVGPATDAAKSVATAAATPAQAVSQPVNVRLLILGAWIAGMAVVFLGLLVRQRLLRGIERAARPVDDPQTVALFAKTCAEMNLTREVRLLQSADSLMPMTWRWRRPVILLPAAATGWDGGRLQLVLRHELGHVKRRDCLAQSVAGLVCALYWFNPLVWVAARQLRVEREHACDDLVLSAGPRPSEYAGHLLEIARQFACPRRIAAMPIARQSGLERRLRAIVDANRKPGRLHPLAALGVAIIIGALFFCVGGWKTGAMPGSQEDSAALQKKQFAGLQKFFAAKEKQTRATPITAKLMAIPEMEAYFAAGEKGDWKAMNDLWINFIHPRVRQYDRTPESVDDPRFDDSHVGTILETWGAWDMIAHGAPKYTQMFGDEIIHSIPAGSIYLGGTDPGRFLITAMSKSHPDGDPFFTVTQNALADGSYLTYLRQMYGDKIQMLTQEDCDKTYSEFKTNAQRRLQHDQDFPNEPRQIKTGEHISVTNGEVTISGGPAVFGINALMAKIVFDKNSSKEFYVEESWALDWMYPLLEPHGLIFKLDREPAQLSQGALTRDRKYWSGLTDGMIGNWLTEETPVARVAEFAEKVFGRRDLSGFTGDPQFVQNDYAAKTFSKLRLSIAGLYAWRLGALEAVPTPDNFLAKSPAERERLVRAADFAFRQAFALCPYGTDVADRYEHFLTLQNRVEDAALVKETAAHIPKPPPWWSVKR